MQIVEAFYVRGKIWLTSESLTVRYRIKADKTLQYPLSLLLFLSQNFQNNVSDLFPYEERL